MKRYLCIGLSVLLCFIESFAQTISQADAVKKALNYWDSRHSEESAMRKVAKRTSNIPTYTAKAISPKHKAPLYVIQMDDGWMLMSSEKAVEPVLAYSPTGKFPNYEDMPDGMKGLLSYYEEANAYARDNIGDANAMNANSNSTLVSKARKASSSGSNLLTHCLIKKMAQVCWDQSGTNDGACVNTYNAQCPTWYDVKCGRTIVGCVAVAMGQIMWYYQWPHAAFIPKQPIRHNQVTNTTIYKKDPYLATYDWTHIPAKLLYYTDASEANQVALLLRDCGYACNMDYGKDGSGATLNDAAKAMHEVFRYKSSIQYKSRSMSDYGPWFDMLKRELIAGRPVIYEGGTKLIGGERHAFVVIGFTEENKYRINWGVGYQVHLGEYSLDVLGENGQYFDYHQGAIIGIEPDYPTGCGENYVLSNKEVSKSPQIAIHMGGTITTSANVGHITSDQKGYIYAGEEVLLKPPFYIDKGANIQIAIRNAHCGANRNKLPAITPEERKETEENEFELIECDDFSVSPNPTTDYIEIRSNAAFRNIAIINSRGQCVIQSTNKYISVYGLPSGLYIIRAITEDNNVKQAKFLKQ